MASEKGNTESPPELGRFIGYGVFLFSFAVYLATLAPSVTFWDSGELILGALSLGNSHPPAYPMFCLLGKGFSFIPLGNAAYRVNLLAASSAACAACMLFTLVKEMGSGRPGIEWVAAGLALSFAFLRSLWSVSVLSEMYALNAFLLIATVYMMLLYDKGGRDAYLYASAFLLGLALVNHQSVLMFIPAYAAYHLFSRENYKKPVVLLQSLFFFLLGYSVIFYMPIRAAASPAINIGDPKSLANFMWSIKWPENIAMIESLFKNAIHGMTGLRLFYLPLGPAACAVMLYVLRKKLFLFMLAFSAVLYYVGTNMVTAPITKWGLQSKFYTPVFLFFGLAAVSALFQFWVGIPGNKARGVAWTVPLVFFCLAFPLGVMAYNYDEVDNSRNFFAYDLASNTLKSVGQDAAIFAWGDNGIFPVWYLQGAERFRDDVFFIHTEILTYPWYMADRRAGMYRKYGIRYTPPPNLLDLKASVPIMRLMLEKATPTYFDFSAASQLGYKMELLKPQGLVYLTPTWEAVPLGSLWGKYALRGAFDNTTNKAFAAEGILEIYAWESSVWAQVAYADGKTGEAIQAYDLAKNLGLKDDSLDRWAEGLKESRVR